MQYLVTDSFFQIWLSILPWLNDVAEPFISRFFELSVEIRYLNMPFKVNVCSFPANRGQYIPNCKKEVFLCLSDEFTNEWPKIHVVKFSNESPTSPDPSTFSDIIFASKMASTSDPPSLVTSKETFAAFLGL